eukprot:Nitzschia sp. Nitz4//scaffold1_size375055//3591//5220//NITZ4_000202-RA/size375055-augustus-gene-0.657-mRNA-1//1//CDS//3329540823//6874//frame0
MIPTGDHSSRTLTHRRVTSWASWSEGPIINDSQREDGNSSQEEEGDDLSRPLLPQLEYEEEEDDLLSFVSTSLTRKKWKLWLVFVLLVISGVANLILAKLQALPMYNYPTFLSMYANVMYVTLSFAYILPVASFGWFHSSIPMSHLTNMSKKPFMVMGFLDALASSMQILSMVYLPGKLIVLLPQAAIPLTMLGSRCILGERFTQYQYLGALVVFMGIVLVLFPVVTQQHAPEFTCQSLDGTHFCPLCQAETTQADCESHHMEDDFMTDTVYCQWVSKQVALRDDDTLVPFWSMVMVASCIPMVLSSLYKQVALQVQLDPILVNGWVSVFQFIFGLIMVFPAGYLSSPRVKPHEIAPNWWHASQCLFSRTNTVDDGCHPDDCSHAALWVHLALLSSVLYSVSMILVLKYGSASLLYLGLTVTVPLGHLAFSLNTPSDTYSADVTGLIVLVAGLILYRFGHEEEDEGETTAEIPTEEDAVNGEGVTATDLGDDKNGFLEFLREPFMLVGDI